MFQVSVPGSVMLMGEHAVLHGSLSIVSSIKRYIKATLTPRDDQQININAGEFGSYIAELNNLVINAKFKFVLAAIVTRLSQINSGFDLQINSDFSAELGLGSSAAVTVAVLRVLALWLDGAEPQKEALIQAGIAVVRQVQGMGSGADVAASVVTGVVAYRSDSFYCEELSAELPLTLIYSGSKKPTVEVVAMVEKQRQSYPELFAELYKLINSCVKFAIDAAKQGDLQRLGELMNLHQGLQDALGVNNKLLSELIYELRAQPGIYGAKISGSGLGDCVVGLGEIKNDCFPATERQKSWGVKHIL